MRRLAKRWNANITSELVVELGWLQSSKIWNLASLLKVALGVGWSPEILARLASPLYVLHLFWWLQYDELKVKTLWWVIFLNDSECIHPLQAFLPSTPSKIRAKDAVCTGHTWAFEPKPLERSKYQCQSLVWWHYQLIGKFPLAQSQVSKRSGIRKPVANKDSLELMCFSDHLHSPNLRFACTQSQKLPKESE